MIQKSFSFLHGEVYYNDESCTKENVLGECEENFLHVQIPGSYRKFWDNTITV